MGEGIFSLAVMAHQWEAERIIASQIFQLEMAALPAQIGAVAAGAVPVIGMAGVFAALGSGYLGARDEVRKENMASGYSQGFITGLLDWEWSHVIDKFGRHGVIRINKMDEATDEIRVKAHTASLRLGFYIAKKSSSEQKKAYLRGIKNFANANPGNWTRNEQITYVIDLSTTYRKKFMK